MLVEPVILPKSRALTIVVFGLLFLVLVGSFEYPVPTLNRTGPPNILSDQVQGPLGGLTAVNVTVNKNPEGVAYDNGNGYVYVTNLGPSQSAPGIVSILAGATVVANVTVGDAPLGVVYNDRNGIVYVANYNSGTLSEISGTNLVGNIIIGSFPRLLTYDSGNGLVYVTEGMTSSTALSHLIALNGTSVVANVTIGIRPTGIAYDPANENVYVVDIGANPASKGTVIEVAGASVVANITVGVTPLGIAYDDRDGNMYVSDAGNNLGQRGNVTVISGSSVVQTITVGINPVGVVFDNGDGQIYVSNYGSAGPSGNGFVFSLNGTSITGNVTVGRLPIELAYDNGNGYVYVVNGNSNSVSVLIQTSSIRFDYALYNSGPIVVQPGGNGTITVTATLSSGAIQPVTLSCLNPLPNGISCTWITKGSPGSTQDSLLMISVTRNTPDENVYVQVDGWPLGATTKPTVIGVEVSSGQKSPNILGLDLALFYSVLGATIGVVAIAGILVYRKWRPGRRARRPQAV